MEQKALEPLNGAVVQVTPEVLERGREASRRSPRRRMMVPIQRAEDAPVQRLLNFMQPGTYVQPHRHREPGACETLSLLGGKLEVLHFSPRGDIISRFLLTSECPVVDLEPDVWHGMRVLESDTVVLEIKKGPYDPATDKDFASWAPSERELAEGAEPPEWFNPENNAASAR